MPQPNTMTQDEALDILKTGANVFLTGEPGAGKTHTVNRYVSWLRDRGIEPAITASTGIAATHIGGSTIHSWTSIGIARSLTSYDLDRIAQNERTVKRVRAPRVLIIDEVSMLSADTLAMAEAVCREIRSDRGDETFGGLQVILVGDFFQLPPIVTPDPEAQDMLFSDEVRALFAFDSPVWRKLAPVVCYLSEQHRQEDAAFLELLTAIRRAEVTDAHKKTLASRRLATPPQTSGITRLFSHNADVNRMNDAELGLLKGNTKTFAMTSRGNERVVEGLKKSCLSPETLVLKEGARVMFTKNNFDKGFANGTIGTVEDFDEFTGWPIVRTQSGYEIVAEPMEWTVEEQGRVIAGVEQIPLRLAWAITVHKSQGMSLDSAHMDLSQAFEYGQGYVALSRVRTLAGLTLAGLNARALEVHPQILEKDGEFRELSDEARALFGDMPREELATMHKNFVKACGGKEPEPGTAPRKAQPLKEKQKKGSSLETTFVLLKEGKSVADIAVARGLAESTISGHIFELLAAKRIDQDDLAKLASPALTAALPTINAVFKELGAERLTPVFEKLKGKYSYDDLRLARALYDSKYSSL